MASFANHKIAYFLFALGAVMEPAFARAEEEKPLGFEATKSRFEAAAARIDVLDPSVWLYDRFSAVRPGRYELSKLPSLEKWPFPAIAERRSNLEKLLDQDFAASTVVRLLKHENPRVRTLAIVYLFDSEDPRQLPHLIELADDDAQTFPRPQLISSALSLPPEPPPPPLLQTVGEVATRAVNFYLQAAGYHYGISGSRNNPGFDDYWELRRDRDWCTSWFAVRFRRAMQGTTPISGQRMDHIRDVRRQIDQVAEPDCTFILMALIGEWMDGNGSEAFISEKGLINQAKQIDSEVWMAVLRREPPTRDPDLQPTGPSRFLAPIAVFILNHATDLLAPEHAEELLRLSEKWEEAARAGLESGTMQHRWIVAAARLQPKDGVKLLKSSYKLFEERFYRDRQMQLSMALWDIAGRAEIPFLVDWFYSLPVETQIFPSARSQFIQEVTRRVEWRLDDNGEKRRIENLPLPGAAGEDVKHLVAAILRDPRFLELDYYSIRELFITINLWFDEPLVTIESLYDLQSSPPGGVAAFYRDPEGVEKQHPQEVQEFRETLSDWRRILRRSVRTWLP